MARHVGDGGFAIIVQGGGDDAHRSFDAMIAGLDTTQVVDVAAERK